MVDSEIVFKISTNRECWYPEIQLRKIIMYSISLGVDRPFDQRTLLATLSLYKIRIFNESYLGEKFGVWAWSRQWVWNGTSLQSTGPGEIFPFSPFVDSRVNEPHSIKLPPFLRQLTEKEYFLISYWIQEPTCIVVVSFLQIDYGFYFVLKFNKNWLYPSGTYDSI